MTDYGPRIPRRRMTLDEVRAAAERAGAAPPPAEPGAARSAGSAAAAGRSRIVSIVELAELTGYDRGTLSD
jgi:hypothetical protein